MANEVFPSHFQEYLDRMSKQQEHMNLENLKLQQQLLSHQTDLIEVLKQKQVQFYPGPLK